MLLQKTLFSLVPTLCFLLLCSCEFLTDEDFNVSQGQPENFVPLNPNGVYQGNAGEAVTGTTGNTISSLTVEQVDEAVRITDNNGNTYVGTIGFAVGELDPNQTPVLPNTILSTVQFTASGIDQSANSLVNIAGTISLLSTELVSREDAANTQLLFTGEWVETNTGTTASIQASQDGGVRNLADFY